MFTSLEESEQVALVFPCTAPWDPGRRQQRLERGLSHQKVSLHVPAQNPELITCGRHSGQMGGELQGRSQTSSQGSC